MTRDKLAVEIMKTRLLKIPKASVTSCRLHQIELEIQNEDVGYVLP